VLTIGYIFSIYIHLDLMTHVANCCLHCNSWHFHFSARHQ